MISEYRRMVRLLAKQKKTPLTAVDCFAVGYQYLINIMNYYPARTVHQAGMLTFLQMSDSLSATGKVRTAPKVIEGSDNLYKQVIDRVNR